MITYPAALKAVGGAHTGLPPVNLLDVQDVNGNIYYWADRAGNFPNAISGAIAPYSNLAPPVPLGAAERIAWSLPTSVVATPGSGVNATATLTGGEINVYLSWPTNKYPATIKWSGFQMPALPAGAVIDGIYLTAVVTADNGASISTPFLPVPGYNDQGQFSTSNVVSIASLLTASLEVTGGASPPVGPVDQTMYFDSIAAAVYYHIPGGALPGGYTYPGVAAYGAGPYLPWLLSVPQFSFHRSLQTDTGNFVMQNLSGDTLSRDFERIMRRSTLEGAMFVYRLWQADAEAAWLEVHGTLSVSEVGVDTATLKGSPLLNPSQDDTPLENYCETCQIDWGGARCGSTQPTECNYSFQTCQVVERIMVAMNNYEKNFGEATANTALNVINRRRKI